MEISKKTPNGSQHPSKLSGGNGAHDSGQLLEQARADADSVLKELGSQPSGLNQAEADSRLTQVGSNEIAREQRQSALMRLLSNIKNPLVLLLTALGVLSFLTGDQRATVVIFVMVVLGVVLRFVQEMRADNAAQKLQAMVSNTATLVRGGKEEEVPLKTLVPGDVIRLAAGDMVPADIRVLSAKDRFLNQVTLTGEVLPVEKKATPAPADVQNPLELPNTCFLGSSVESGSATEQPAGAGAGRAGRPAGVRQHRQVHQDGGQLELRQHVQCRRSQRVSAVHSHAADPGADQQPPVRLLADHHPHR
jgi:P-type Mg2+ transporter